MTSLLAPGKPVEAPATLGTPPSPVQPPEVPSRPVLGKQRLKLSPRETVQALTSGRQQQREARVHAEAWYQALREWGTVNERGEYLSGAGPRRSSGRMQVVGIGSYGGPPGGFITYSRLHTPLGWVSESNVTALCNADPLLSEVRRGAGLATLMHASGRGWAGERARAYARAVLRLAAVLGDPRAGECLQHLVFAEDSSTISVDSQE
ncbi:hypothetical protein [Deinococcus carri]